MIIGNLSIFLVYCIFGLLPNIVQTLTLVAVFSYTIWTASMRYSFPRRIKERVKKGGSSTTKLINWCDFICYKGICFCWGAFFVGAVYGELFKYTPVSMFTAENVWLYSDTLDIVGVCIFLYTILRGIILFFVWIKTFSSKRKMVVASLIFVTAVVAIIKAIPSEIIHLLLSPLISPFLELPGELQSLFLGTVCSYLIWIWSMNFSFPRKIRENVNVKWTNTLVQLMTWCDIFCYMYFCFFFGLILSSLVVGDIIGHEPVAINTQYKLLSNIIKVVLPYVIFRFVVYLFIRRNSGKVSTYKVQLTKKKP